MKEMGIKLSDMSTQEVAKEIVSAIKSSRKIDEEEEIRYTSVSNRFMNKDVIANPYNSPSGMLAIRLDSQYRNTLKVQSTTIDYHSMTKAMMSNNITADEYINEVLDKEEIKHRSPLYIGKLFINNNLISSKYLLQIKSESISDIMTNL